MIETIERIVKPITYNPYRKAPVKKTPSPAKDEDIVTMLNDCHFGHIVRPHEIGGVNRFDFQIAARRVAMAMRETLFSQTEKTRKVHRSFWSYIEVYHKRQC